VAGDEKAVAAAPIPNRYDQTGLLFDCVENNIAPGMSVTVTAAEKSLPLCSIRRIRDTRAVRLLRRVRTSAQRRRAG
jgi:hypothetical protein